MLLLCSTFHDVVMYSKIASLGSSAVKKDSFATSHVVLLSSEETRVTCF